MSKNKHIFAHRQEWALSLQQRLLVPAPVQSRPYKSVQHTAASQESRQQTDFLLSAAGPLQRVSGRLHAWL